MNHKIAIIVGSLRKESFNRKMANAMISLAPDSLDLEILEIGQLQMYNQDLDENPPKEWIEFKNQITSFDGVIFVTPEYNRSVPGVLKNAIDVGSRPYGQSAWDAKPAAIVSVTPGTTGAFGANHHLRQSLVFLNMPTLQQPEMYISGAAKMFGAKGEIVQDSTRELVSKFLETFSRFVDRHAENSQAQAQPQSRTAAEKTMRM